ncbi:molybdopterin-containing oxidoreductase family protein, partial [Frankia nepalensis]
MIAHSYCRICPALCGITVTVDDATGRVTSVDGDPDHPLSRGFTCSKGRALAEDHNAPDRLDGSLRRAGERWEPVSSDAAVAEIGDRLSEIVDRHGPRSVGLYVGTRGYEVLQLAGATAWLSGVGSPSLYSTYTIDQPAKDVARALHGSWPAGFQEWASSDVVMFVGNNPVVSATASYIGMPVTNPRRAIRERRRAGLKVIVIDPRRTETAALADIHLQPVPGTDGAVLAGMVHVILAEGLYDSAFTERYTEGLERLRAAVAPFHPEAAAARGGVAVDQLIAAARLFATAGRGCAIGGTGINMAPHPILSEYLLLCLNSLCGRYMRAGDQVANPGVLGGGRSLREGVRGPRQPWGKGPQPRVRGLSNLYDQLPAAALADEILTPGDGQLRALIVSGGNPLVALPDMAKSIEALSSLELLVTLDVRMTQTARLSDFLIAAPMSLERSDVTLASDLRFPKAFAQYAPAVVAPPGDLVEEWEFFWALARRMGTQWDLRGRIGMPVPINVADTFDPRVKPTTEQLWEILCTGSRIPLATLREHPHGLAPELPPVVVRPDERLDDGQRLALADPLMIDELAAVAAERTAVGPAPGQPTGRRRAGTTPPADAQDLPYLLISRRLSRYHN